MKILHFLDSKLPLMERHTITLITALKKKMKAMLKMLIIRHLDFRDVKGTGNFKILNWGVY